MAIKEVNKKPITDKQLVKSKFWSKFNSYSQASEGFCKELTPHPYADTRKYQDYAVGHGAYHLTLSVDFQKETCAVGVYFRDVESWDVYYSEYREAIEDNIGTELEWTRHKTKASVYLIESHKVNNEEEWEDAFEFLVTAAIEMKHEFAKYHSAIKKYWLVSWNEQDFRLHDFMEKYDTIDWNNIANNQFNIGDVVYLYCSYPEQSIRYKMVVTRTEVPEEEEIDDEDFSLSDTDKPSQHVYRIKRTAVIDEPLLGYKYLLEHGLNGSVRSPRILRGELLNYIKSTIAKQPSDSDFEELSDTDTLFEGAKKTVIVNQYERNQEARRMCIAANGYKCKVCGMDFEKSYGEIGRGFIHVHHIVPISTIGEEYQLDPVKDLVPVCPNCHAMLHRGIDGKVLTVDELKKLISNKDKI